MDVFLPKGFQAGDGWTRSRQSARVPKLGVEAGGVQYPVLRRWQTGFAVSAADVPTLEGVVELFDGSASLGECLIVKAEKAEGEKIFTIKRAVSFDYASATEIDASTLAEPLNR